ncbi:hypothetical protein DV096_03425 [Bradymonadaceae bacterium TMQ3]|nr:hypothetical protein DV096_03425 [Bradymonadaceae bacterium TMQ3]TXC77626.1 hypothetical protein FRC91_02495 [Bradymonadales bacterium TMQ1]
MARISKQVAHREAIKENVRSSMERHREQVVKAVERALFGGQAPASLTMGEFFDALTGSLESAHQEFAALEQQLSVERGEESRARVRRDEAAEEMRQALIRVRGLIEGFWSPQAAVQAGFIGVTPQVHRDLVVYAQNVEAHMEGVLRNAEAALALPLPDIGGLRETVRRARVGLEAALVEVGAEERDALDLQNRRDQAAEAWNKTYIPVANIVEHLFRLADMHAWADQVRPTARRRAGIAEPEDLDVSGDDASGEVVDEEPAPVAE